MPLTTMGNGFNPRPSLLTDESTDRYWSYAALREFQSTSVIADGRKNMYQEIYRSILLFQSTSVIADGRKVRESEANSKLSAVSIHVRHC